MEFSSSGSVASTPKLRDLKTAVPTIRGALVLFVS